MVLSAKRFGAREWFVIHHPDVPAPHPADDGTRELNAPLVVPVVIVTASEEERDRVVRDLVAHIDGVLGRGTAAGSSVIEMGELRMDKVARRVSVGGEDVLLTAMEFRLLAKLVERRDMVQTRAALLTEVWGASAHSKTRTVDTHVTRLRHKLRTAGRFVQSVRGVGYRFSTTIPRQPRDNVTLGLESCTPSTSIPSCATRVSMSPAHAAC
jgi:DNA-binding response OmpR family regulator